MQIFLEEIYKKMQGLEYDFMILIQQKPFKVIYALQSDSSKKTFDFDINFKNKSESILSTLFPENQSPFFRELSNFNFESDFQKQIEYQITSSSGKQLNLITHFNSLIINKNVYILAIVKVITDLKYKFDKIERFYKRYLGVINLADCWVIETNETLNITYTNKKSQDFIDFSSNDLINTSLFSLFNENESNVNVKIIENHIKNEQKFENIKIELKKKDSSLLVVECSGEPEFSEEGNITGYFILIQKHHSLSNIDKEINVAIVEDHKMTSKLLELVLNSSKTIRHVENLSSGKEILSYLKTNTVDIVIMDVIMPEMDGIQTLAKIKELYPEIKVIMLSSNIDANIVKKSLALGAEGYISKSVDFNEINIAINTATQGGCYLCKPALESLTNSSKLQSLEQFIQEEDYIHQFHKLTIREKEILKLISSGLSNNVIADKLFTSKRTIESHRRNILHKFKEKNFINIIKIGLENSLLD